MYLTHPDVRPFTRGARSDASMILYRFGYIMPDLTQIIEGGLYMTSRRKSIGRGDEASGPVMSASASMSMRSGRPKDAPRRYGTPKEGMYSRKLDGSYGASVSDFQ
ncbi:hypothetical protein N007_12700 [Alicyclobacillus acidoterrestris ATCC 49025]|nr:hypothetical protein N007_12700 [Alicyclobacillus acidoterrestris ATCC 49025]